MSNSDNVEHMVQFNSKLDNHLQNQTGKNTKFLSQQEYKEILNCLEEWMTLSILRKKKIGYNIVKRYKKLKTAEETKQLVYASESENTGLIKVTHQQRVFHDLFGIHQAAGHSKGIIFLKAVNRTFMVPRSITDLLVSIQINE